ncbi:phosphoserine phosphatase SerB, partial [Xanthomonas citri pv. citri]|nr:phosphoserine phosphatase SerB [Xanthomonas citri pv. citri]
VTADPALLLTDVPPIGVPDDAERLSDDGLLGWRFTADEWAAAPEPGSGWDVLTLPAAVASAPVPLVLTDVDSTLIRQEVIEL